MVLYIKYPNKSQINLNCHLNWQDLKEALANEISNNGSSTKTLHTLHAKTISFGLHQNLYICTHLVSKYFHFDDTQSPQDVFNSLYFKPTKTLFWNSLIKGFLKNGLPRKALNLYKDMIQSIDPNRQTYHLVLNACTHLSEFEFGHEVEEHARSRGMHRELLVATELVNMYSTAGDLENARRVFDEMSHKDVVAWNAMICGYSQCGVLCEAMKLFQDMRSRDGIFPNAGSLVSVITGYGVCGLGQNGNALHAIVVKIGYEDDANVSNSLMGMYIAYNRLALANKLFKGMVLKDAISWSIMIDGCVKNGLPHAALNYFQLMVANARIPPTRPILLSVLIACADLSDYNEGKCIMEKYLVNDDGEVISDARLVTALIYMYAKCGKTRPALELLNENALVRDDVVAWNAIIKACAGRNRHNLVLELTITMQRKGIKFDTATFLALLSTISLIPLSSKGMEAHNHIIKNGFESERTVANSLINMYAKFGSVSDSCKIFNNIHDKDVVSWSSVINAYSWNGLAQEALGSFHMMRKTNIRPNSVTFLATLSACSHANLVHEAKELFVLMEKEYSIKPDFEHFTCMVDLFCRSGLVKDAYCLIKLYNMKNDCKKIVLWGSLLSACRVHRDIGIGEKAARHLFLLEPRNAANYLMLADIYISEGKREEANSVLDLMREKGLERRIACSRFDEGTISIYSMEEQSIKGFI